MRKFVPGRRTVRKSTVKNLLFCLVLAVLSACTGTSEERLPTLLAVSLGGSAQPQVALVRTTLTTSEEAQGGFAVLEDSRRALAAPAVDFAVTERNGSRSELVVLSSAGGATPNTEVDGSAVYLNFFSLQGVDAASPDAFAPTRAQRTLGSFTSAPASFCPEAVQTSRTGRYVVVFNASRCGSAASLDLFDTQTNRALPRLTGGTFGLVDAPPYLDQQADTLYYLQQKVSTADLIAVRLTDIGNGADVDFPATTLATLPDRDQRGLTQVGTTLLALYPSSFLSVPIATPTQNVLVDTLSDSRRFIDNLSPFETSVLILGDNRLTVHRLLDDADEQSTPVTVTSATYDPLERFVYLVGDRQITRFDLLRYDGDFSGLLRTFEVVDLVQPGPVTWFKGVVPVSAP